MFFQRIYLSEEQDVIERHSDMNNLIPYGVNTTLVMQPHTTVTIEHCNKKIECLFVPFGEKTLDEIYRAYRGLHYLQLFFVFLHE